MRALFAITIVAAASISGAWSAMAQYGPARNLNPYGYYGYNEYLGYYRSTSLCAKLFILLSNALLCSRLSRPTLWLQGLVLLAIVRC